MRFPRNFILALAVLLPVLSGCGGRGMDFKNTPQAPQSPASLPDLTRPGLFEVQMSPQEKLDLSARGISMLAPRQVLSALPLPAAGREASCFGGWFKLGGDYEDAASQANVARSGTEQEAGTFTPAWSVGSSLGDSSYAIYRWNLSAFDGQQTIGVHWAEGSALPASGEFFIGLADLATDRWDWYAGPADGVLTIDSFGPYRDSGGDVLLVLLFVGSQQVSLASFEAGLPETRSTGAVDMPGDAPDYPLLGDSGSIPSSFDLSAQCAPINDQMTWGSCTAFAVGDGAFNYELGQTYGSFGWDLTQSRFRVSPKYLYIKSGELQGFPPGGDYGRWTENVISDLVNYGVATEEHAPYNLLYSNDWSPEALADTQVLKIEDFEEVPCNSDEGIATIKRIISQQRKVLPMQVYLDASFFDLLPGQVWFPQSYPVGGHAMCIVGYDDAKSAFKVRNSWGEYWGDGGYVWIAYLAFFDYDAAIRAWTIKEQYSPQVVEHFNLDSSAIPPVTGVAASDGTSTAGIDVSWDVHPGSTVYSVFRDSSDNKVGEANAPITSWTDTSISDSYGHVYWVKADTSPLSAPDVGYRAAIPQIFSVSPAGGLTSSEVSISAAGLGSAPLSWNWNFGAAATPSSSTASRPLVTLGEPGTYNCSVHLENSLGEIDYDFQLVVEGIKPIVTSIASSSGFAGESLELLANVTGGAETYAWDFGGGASPNTSTAAQPVVTLGAAGSYEAELEVNNEAGSDTYFFKLTVLDGEPAGWTSLGFDSRHSGQSPVTGPQDNNLAWRYLMGVPGMWDYDNIPRGVLTLDNGDVLTAFNNRNEDLGILRCLHPDGSPVWDRVTKVDEPAMQLLGIGDQSGNLYVQENENLLALNPVSGALLWSKPTISLIGEAPNGTLYGFAGKELVGYSPADGSPAFSPVLIADKYGTNSAAIIAPSGMLYLSTKIGYDRLLMAFDTNTNTPHGVMDNSTSIIRGFALSADSSKLFAMREGGEMLAFSTGSCNLLWRQNGTNGGGSNPPCVMADGTVVMFSKGGVVYALDPVDGAIKWSLDLQQDQDCNCDPAIGRDGTIYIGCPDRKLHAVRNGAEIWSGAALGLQFDSNIAIGADGLVYGADRKGYLNAYGPGSGEELLPPLAQDVSPLSGDQGTVVNMTVSTTGSQPLTYAWDFGGGATPNTSTEISPAITLGAPGFYDATVTVSNPYGSSTVDFTLHVLTGPLQWTRYSLAADTFGVGRLAVIDGKPAAAYAEMGSNDTYYAYAATTSPQSAGDWTKCMLIDETLDVKRPNDLIDFGGRPAMLADGKFALATDSSPTMSSDWTVSNFLDVPSQDNERLLIVENKLALAFTQYDGLQTTDTLSISYANINEPVSPSDWTHYPIATYKDLLSLNALTVAGTPVIAVHQYQPGPRKPLWFGTSLTKPIDSGDWSHHEICLPPDQTGRGMGLSLQVLNGKPIASHIEEGANGYVPYFSYSSVANPDSTDDWTTCQVDPNQTINNSATTVGQIGGLPVMLYGANDDKHLQVAVATTESPTGFADWNVSPVDTVANTGWESHMISVGGSTLVLYFDYNGNNTMIAVLN